jgi:hypothetical protein
MQKHPDLSSEISETLDQLLHSSQAHYIFDTTGAWAASMECS